MRARPIGRFILRMAPCRKRFSRPVSSGWNQVPTSSSEPSRLWTSTSPADGSVIRERILSRVLLPAPLRPMRPRLHDSKGLRFGFKVLAPWGQVGRVVLTAQTMSADSEQVRGHSEGIPV